MGDETTIDVRSAESTLENDRTEVDPAYSSDDGKSLPEVWASSDELAEILDRQEEPDRRAIEVLRRALRRQIPTAETYRSVLRFVDPSDESKDLISYVILFPGDARDNTGIKDLNDKSIGYQFNGKYIAQRQKHIEQVFGGDFEVVGQNYKSAFILSNKTSRKDFDERLTTLDGKLRESLLKILDEAEDRWDNDRDTPRDVREARLREIRKLRRTLKKARSYRFDIYFGTRSGPRIPKELKNKRELLWTFILVTEALKAAGIARYITKGKSVVRLARQFGKAAKPDRRADDRGKLFQHKEYLGVVTQATKIKDYVAEPWSANRPYDFNTILVDTVWTVAFSKRRRRYFPNRDVIRAVRKRGLKEPSLRDKNVKVTFRAQKELLELWLVVHNTIDFVKYFLDKEFTTGLQRQHDTARKLLDDLDASPPTVDWTSMSRILTRDLGSAPIAMLGRASEYMFYSGVADESEWIIISMDVRDLGVDLVFLYEEANEEIEDRRLADHILLEKTFQASDPVNERMRYTYERVEWIFRSLIHGSLKKARKEALEAARKAFPEDPHARLGLPGDSPLAARIMLGGDEVFVAANPAYADDIPFIIKTLNDVSYRGEKLNMRAVVAFSQAERVKRPAAAASESAHQRALDKQREANQRAHQQALDACDAAPAFLKNLEGQQRRIERLVDMLRANDEKKHLAKDFAERLDKLGLLRVFVRIGYGGPRVLPPLQFIRRTTRLRAGKLSSKNREEVVDFDGNVIDRVTLTQAADALEKEVREKVGRDNTHIDPPPAHKIPGWLDDILNPDKDPKDPKATGP